MPQNFIACDRDQQMLLQTDMRKWLSADHLVWFVIDAVAQMDLSAFYQHYRADGWGRAAYDPRMMVTLLMYAYAVGVRSAREIERRCQTDVAFRIITANQRVDHATICRFRTRHREALSGLFVGVLGLCAKADMVRPALVAIDGTKVAANASLDANVTREQLEELARQIFDDAERIDAEEDELYGERRGDAIPEHLIDRAARLEWLKAKLDEQQRAAEETTKNATERKPRINTTDPDSAVQRTAQGYLQGYNGQLAVTEDQVIVAADLVADNTDDAQLEPMVTQANDNLEATTAERIEQVVADAGYFRKNATTTDLGVDLLVAPVATRDLEKAIGNREDPVEITPEERRHWELARAHAARRAARREELIAAVMAKQVTAAEAARELGIKLRRVYYLVWQYRKFGRVSRGQLPAPPPDPSATQVMLERFAHPGALETYNRRAAMIEPVFGQLKEIRCFRRLLHRGLAAGRCEWRMMAAAHNLRKLWKGDSSARAFHRGSVPSFAAA